jgi:hypothetical protein
MKNPPKDKDDYAYWRAMLRWRLAAPPDALAALDAQQDALGEIPLPEGPPRPGDEVITIITRGGWTWMESDLPQSVVRKRLAMMLEEPPKPPTTYDYTEMYEDALAYIQARKATRETLSCDDELKAVRDYFWKLFGAEIPWDVLRQARLDAGAQKRRGRRSKKF